MKFSANLSFLFTEVPFLERFKAARESGFEGVEFLFPYDVAADDLAAIVRASGVEVVLFNVWPGDFAGGERGLAGIRGREAEFAERLEQALEYARALGCRQLHTMSGLIEHGAEEATLIENLKRGADVVAREGVRLLTEPINRRDMPGYLVHRTGQARNIIRAVGADNVGLQFDCYHRQIEEGGVAAAIDEFADLTAHYQIAGSPDRGEPDQGDLNYSEVFGAIRDTGYADWIGCEYRPRGETVSGLMWREALEAR